MKQPHEMTDTELNLAMIFIYFGEDWRRDKDIFRIYAEGKLNYLEDYNRTMPLAVKSNIKCNFSSKESYVEHRLTYNIYSYSDNPLRAICEVLVAIAMEQKK